MMMCGLRPDETRRCVEWEVMKGPRTSVSEMVRNAMRGGNVESGRWREWAIRRGGGAERRR